jgi:hypothetical protein
VADIAKSGIPSPCSPVGTAGLDQTTGLVAGEALGAIDACYVKASDGKVYRSTGAAANAAAAVHGYAARAYPIGKKGVTLLHGSLNVNYGSGLTPGVDVYLSGATAGALADAVSTGGTKKLGFAVDATRIRLYGVSGA